MDLACGALVGRQKVLWPAFSPGNFSSMDKPEWEQRRGLSGFSFSLKQG